jgi:hypothetical protein
LRKKFRELSEPGEPDRLYPPVYFAKSLNGQEEHMAYLSQFPSAENMLGVAPAASRSAGGLRLAAWISSMAKAIGDYIDMMADFYAAATLYDELSRLSDAELHRRGLARDILARDVGASGNAP